MSRQQPSVEAKVREAFELLLQIRAHPEACRLLSLAIGFLKTVVRDTDGETTPVVISVQAVRIPKT